MFYLGWALAGAMLGWLIYSVGHQASSAGFRARIISTNVRIALKLILILTAVAALAGLAIFSDALELPPYLMIAKTLLSGRRFEALAIGFAVGILGARYGAQLARISRAFFTALLGTESGSPWVLQTAVALLVLVGITFAIRPDLLEHIQSFKAGNFEATFAARSSNVRQANLNLNDITQDFTLDVYDDFAHFYLENDSARALATAWFDQTPAKAQRREILLRVFPNYINPVIVSLSCLKANESLEIARRDYNMATLATGWENFLLKLNSGPMPSRDAVRSFFDRSHELTLKIVTSVRAIDPECMMKEKQIDAVKPDDDAEFILAKFDSARLALKSSGMENPETYALTIIDPYIVGAASDLVAFLFGQKEKADFLSRIAQKYPNTEKMLQTGIINLYYQLSDAKMKSEGSWPLDQVIAELDYATLGANFMVSQSETWASQHPDPENRAGADKIFDAYSRNRFLFLTLALEIYNQRALAGEPIRDFHHQNWTRALSQLTAIIRARSNTPVSTFDDLPISRLDEKSLARWPSIKIEQRLDFDGNMAAALSAILSAEDQRRPSRAACAAALHYLGTARSTVGKVVAEGSLSVGSRSRIEQFVSLARERITASCE